MYVCICIYIHIYIHTYMWFTYTFILWIYVYICMCVYICFYIFILCKHAHICMFSHMYTPIYTNTYTKYFAHWCTNIHAQTLLMILEAALQRKCQRVPFIICWFVYFQSVICISRSLCPFFSLNIYISVWECVNICVCVCVGVCVCVYVCVCVCVSVCVYIFTSIHCADLPFITLWLRLVGTQNGQVSFGT